MSQSQQGEAAQNTRIDLQWQCSMQPEFPADDQIRHWAAAAVGDVHNGSELVIRVIESSEMQAANRDWRGRDKPTNVLSFPAELPDEFLAEAGISHLGDILICADVLVDESAEQNKTLHAHWAHIVVHGVLHLQGYDHVQEHEAVLMEQREIEILDRLGYTNPYEPN